MKIVKELFTRNDKKIQKMLVEKDDTMEITEPLFILFPERFIAKEMAKIANKIEVIGAFMIMNNDHEYTVMSLPNLIQLSPTTIETIQLNDIPYVLMGFKDIMISSMGILFEANTIVTVINEFIVKSNVPFYFNTTDLFKLLNKSAITTPTNITKNTIVSELLTSLVVKGVDISSTARSQLSREDMDDIEKIRILGLENISGLGNNISKIMGNYFNLGLTSALVDDGANEETELEKILKL